MSTDRNYGLVRDSTISNPPTVATAAPTFPTTDDRQSIPIAENTTLSTKEFIHQNSDLIDFNQHPLTLTQRFSERLQATPVLYETVLDGIALLRAFISTLDDEPDAHYALLLEANKIIGCVRFMRSQGTPYDYLPIFSSEKRIIMRYMLASNADSILLGSSITSEIISDRALAEVWDAHSSFDSFGIELLDWIFLYPEFNSGYVLRTMGEEALDDGVTVEQYTSHYVDFMATFTPTGHD